MASFGSGWHALILCSCIRNLGTESRELRTGSSVHHFLLLFIHRDSERLKWRSIHRHRNTLHSRCGGREAIPASLFRDEVHKKHLSIDFKSQFAFLFPGPIAFLASRGMTMTASNDLDAAPGRSTRPPSQKLVARSRFTSCLRHPRTRRRLRLRPSSGSRRSCQAPRLTRQ